MQVIFQNAESEFQKILDSMATNPSMWQNWKCLHIEAASLEDYKINPDLMAYAEAIIDVYLLDYEGAVYFCGCQDLYLMIRDIEKEKIRLIGSELSASLFLERACRANQHIYNLSSETLELIFTICGRGRLFKVAEDAIPEIPVQEVRKTKTFKELQNQPRVLLIEDDQSTRWIVRKALKGLCDLATAQNISTSHKRILSFDPDLIFLDIELPDGSGIDILDWLMEENLKADVIMFSSHNTMDNISMAMAAGAKGFISKPFAKSQLVEHLQGCQKLH